MTPSLVLFDLDGVLVAYDRARRVRHLGESLKRDADTVYAALFGSGLENRFDGGEIGTDEYLATLGESLQAPVSRSQWAAARAAAMQLDAATLALVERTARHCDIAILTNNGPLLGDVLPQALPALFPRFAGRVLCSGMLGGRKPEGRVYLEALRRLGHPPARTLFLDDLADNVDGARRAGLHAERVDAPGDFADILDAYGLT